MGVGGAERAEPTGFLLHSLCADSTPCEAWAVRSWRRGGAKAPKRVLGSPTACSAGTCPWRIACGNALITPPPI